MKSRGSGCDKQQVYVQYNRLVIERMDALQVFSSRSESNIDLDSSDKPTCTSCKLRIDYEGVRPHAISKLN